MNCIICDGPNAPNYNSKDDEYLCNKCNYWVGRAKGEIFGWQELTELLNDDSITYTMAIEGGKEDGE